MGQRESSLSPQSWYWTCHANPAVLSYVFRSLPQELLENRSKISIAKLDCSCQFQSNPRLWNGLNSTGNSIDPFFRASGCPSHQTSSLFRKRSSHFVLLAKALWHCMVFQDSFRKIFCHFSARSRRSGTAWMHSYLRGGTFQIQSPTKYNVYNMIAIFDDQISISPTQRIKSNTEPPTSV